MVRRLLSAFKDDWMSKAGVGNLKRSASQLWRLASQNTHKKVWNNLNNYFKSTGLPDIGHGPESNKL